MLRPSRHFEAGLPTGRSAVKPEHKLIERVIVGLVATSISVDVLSVELPRVMPYLILLAVVVGVLRLIWWFTQI
jgi:hypothetical protein